MRLLSHQPFPAIEGITKGKCIFSLEKEILQKSIITTHKDLKPWYVS